jgi:hypothetical protein
MLIAPEMQIKISPLIPEKCRPLCVEKVAGIGCIHFVTGCFAFEGSGCCMGAQMV